MIEDIAPTEDQEAFAETAGRCFAECQGLAPREIAAKLGEMGLLGVMASEADGGLDLGAAEAWRVVRAAGSALLAYPLAEAIAAASYVEGLADGAKVATICWAAEIEARADGAAWRIHGVAPRTPNAAVADVMLLCGANGIFMVDLASAGVDVTPADELDIERAFGDVVLLDVAADCVGSAADAAELGRLGALLRAADMIGAAESAFDATCTHTGARRQFGKPLSALQVVSTDLARDHYTLECARTSAAYAAIAWDARQDDSDDACAIVAAYAGERLPAVAENAIQLHGAMGFTWDMPLHRWLRRIRTTASVVPSRVERRTIADRLIERWVETV